MNDSRRIEVAEFEPVLGEDSKKECGRWEAKASSDVREESNHLTIVKRQKSIGRWQLGCGEETTSLQLGDFFIGGGRLHPVLIAAGNDIGLDLYVRGGLLELVARRVGYGVTGGGAEAGHHG